ncbi:MAG TPA: hypothetical protein PKW63_08920 [Vicinamibacterales bacterium]|nr:hypothetical protein [Vicinamibacterales bacterium]
METQVRELPAARDLDVPTLNDHIPGLLAELAIELRRNKSFGCGAPLAPRFSHKASL